MNFWTYVSWLFEMAGRMKAGGRFHVPAWVYAEALRSAGLGPGRDGDQFFLMGYPARVDVNMDPDALRYVR